MAWQLEGQSVSKGVVPVGRVRLSHQTLYAENLDG
jgi:hypothetical protein